METVGFVLAVLGLVAVVNHYWSGFQLFNLVNGIVLPVLGLSAYEVLAGGVLIVLGLVVMVAPSVGDES